MGMRSHYTSVHTTWYMSLESCMWVLMESESMSSSSVSSTPYSFVFWSGSQIRVYESHVTFWTWDNKIAFLRTRLPWARTTRSIFGCTNLFLCFLCIHPSMIHIYLHEVALVMTEHNFFVNHVRLSNKTCPFSSMTSCMKVFTQVWWDLLMFRCVKGPSGWSCCFSSDRSYFFALISSCQDTKAGPNVAECFVHVEVSTVHRCVKDIPPSHEQGMQFATRGFRETVNRFTVQFVQDQTQIVQDIRGFTFHTVVDTESL